MIIRGGAIGDFILTLPSIHAFRDFYPKVRLEIMGYPHITDLAKQRFYVETVSSMDHRSVASFFAAKGMLDQTLCQYFSSFDLIVSFLYDPDMIFLENLKRAGASKIIVADGRPSRTIHASEHLSQWLSEAKIPFQICPPKLYPSDQDQKDAEQILPTDSRRTVALHPGSGSPSKNWPIQRFLELAQWLKSQGLRVLVIDGPADSETRAVFWKNSASKDCICCSNISLPILAAVLQKCCVFVGHDSGISHLCAAVGTPAIVIYGPTDPKLWAPRGRSVTVLQKGKSVSLIIVEDVKSALEPYLVT